MLPWVFSLLQIAMATTAGGLGGNLTAEYGMNALFLTIGNGTMWVIHTLMHIIYVPMLKEALYCEGDEEVEAERKKNIEKEEEERFEGRT